MALFKSKRQRELESEIQIRQSKAKIQRFIRQAHKLQKRYWDMGKQALRLGDRQQFAQLAAALIRTREQANHWDRYLLQLETLGIRREEVSATAEFIKGISAATTSILRGATPEQIATMQVKMEQSTARAEALEEMLSMAMISSADGVFGCDELDEQKLDELAVQIGSEAEADESTAYDQRINEGLQQIEKEMREEL